MCACVCAYVRVCMVYVSVVCVRECVTGGVSVYVCMYMRVCVVYVCV